MSVLGTFRRKGEGGLPVKKSPCNKTCLANRPTVACWSLHCTHLSHVVQGAKKKTCKMNIFGPNGGIYLNSILLAARLVPPQISSSYLQNYLEHASLLVFSCPGSSIPTIRLHFRIWTQRQNDKKEQRQNGQRHKIEFNIVMSGQFHTLAKFSS